VGSYATPADAIDVAVVGDSAYVTAADAGLLVLDVHDPALPALFTQIDTTDVACVTDRYGGLLTSDVSDHVDFAQLEACMAGPNQAVDAGCSAADLDHDGDVDLMDYLRLQSTFGYH